MRVIFGIGNPGKEYENTRHNAGFDILDRFAEIHSLEFKPSKGEYFIAGSENIAAPFFLVKPTNYVNNSGLAALDIVERLEIDIENLLVIADDINLDIGKIRIRKSGGDGGHNGIASLIYHLNSDKFPRLRFGIGKDFQKGEMASYVLDKFDDEIQTLLEPKFNLCVDLIEEYTRGGLPHMLNYFSKNSVSDEDKLNNSSEAVEQEK
ncbi:aminoacyl-tRNA hydrolase [Bacteroidota bacterium]